MLFLRLLATAFLFHELLYIFRDGKSYLLDCFLPTLGLQLTSMQHLVLHLLFMISCVAMILSPSNAIVHITVFILLTLVIASYPLRVSNHLVLGWHIMLAVSILQLLSIGLYPQIQLKESLVSITRVLVIVTYFASFFHKLNKDFFSLKHSLAALFGEFYCWDRKINHPKLIKAFQQYSIYSTVFFEGLIPVLLLFPESRWLGIVFAIYFHFSLGILGIVNFSSVMYAALLTFLPLSFQHIGDWSFLSAYQSTLPFVILLFLAIVWIGTARRANRHLPYVHRNWAWVVQFIFGFMTAIYATTFYHIPKVLTYPIIANLAPAELAVLWTVVGLFTLSCLSPYLGLKTEFSMAMFSNLRTLRWNHLLIRKNPLLSKRANYIQVMNIEGLPEGTKLVMDKPTTISLTTLKQFEQFVFRPYFLFEALIRINTAFPNALIKMKCSYQNQEYEFSSRNLEGSPKFPAYTRINLFPFVIPKHKDAPHSEQGSIMDTKNSRQLF